ncbi:MAG: hypothetical protein ACRDV4_10075 [Acidimicrobiales bacterium]
MRARHRGIMVAAAAIVATAGLALLPATAGATGARTHNLWVSSGATSPADNSCSNHGYNSVQAAINAASPGATVHICAGTYTEQLVVTQSVTLTGLGNPTIQLPASPANSTTPCDEASNTAVPGSPEQDGIVVCTAGALLKIQDLTVDPAWPANTCNDNLFGILVGGGASLKMTNTTVEAGGAVPINGCQGGVAIEVGMAWTSPVEVGHATLTHVTVSGYQKNGMTIDGAGSTAKITSSTVSGAGPTTQTAQNGIQVSNGASANITRSTISGNECDASSCGSNSMTDAQGGGVLLYLAVPGTKVTHSSINDNDYGIYSYASNATEPSSPTADFQSDTLINDRYESALLDASYTALTHDTISGGNVGIQVIQYDGQPYGVLGSASHDTVENESVAAIQVLSDNAPSGDMPGTLTVSRSNITSGDATSVSNNSSNYTVTQSHDS